MDRFKFNDLDSPWCDGNCVDLGGFEEIVFSFNSIKYRAFTSLSNCSVMVDFIRQLYFHDSVKFGSGLLVVLSANICKDWHYWVKNGVLLDRGEKPNIMVPKDLPAGRHWSCYWCRWEPVENDVEITTLNSAYITHHEVLEWGYLDEI